MTAHVPIARPTAIEAVLASPWRLHLAALAAVAGALLLLFAHDVRHIGTIWFTTGTYNHCALIPPILAWLVSMRLRDLGQLRPALWLPALLLIAAGAAAWLLGEAGGVAFVRHVALVLMLQGAVVLCLGKAVARGLLFPLFFAFFLVPVGAEIVPLLQTITAEISMVLLGLVGVPAHLEGIFITIPTGYYEVAEACSGMGFAVAMAPFGALVANICFKSWKRRILFLIAAAVLPILANGIRAGGTIYISHLTSIAFAESVNHVIAGWIFFAIVIALLMTVSWRYFDRKVQDPWFDPLRLQPVPPPGASRTALAAASAAAILLAALPLAWSAAVASSGETRLPRTIELPQVSGWTQVPRAEEEPWQPHFRGADLARIGRYRSAAGQEVDLAIVVFARQEEGREIVGYGQGPVAPGGAWAWIASAVPPPGGKADRIASFGTVREVLSFYRVGDRLTGSGIEVKLETMKTRLLGGPQRAVAVLVSSAASAEGVDPRPAIDAFLKDIGPVDRLADRAAGLAS